MNARIRPPPERHVNVPLIIVAGIMVIGVPAILYMWADILVHNFMRLPPW